MENKPLTSATIKILHELLGDSRIGLPPDEHSFLDHYDTPNYRAATRLEELGIVRFTRTTDANLLAVALAYPRPLPKESYEFYPHLTKATQGPIKFGVVKDTTRVQREANKIHSDQMTERDGKVREKAKATITKATQ